MIGCIALGSHFLLNAVSPGRPGVLLTLHILQRGDRLSFVVNNGQKLQYLKVNTSKRLPAKNKHTLESFQILENHGFCQICELKLNPKSVFFMSIFFLNVSRLCMELNIIGPYSLSFHQYISQRKAYLYLFFCIFPYVATMCQSNIANHYHFLWMLLLIIIYPWCGNYRHWFSHIFSPVYFSSILFHI